MLRYENIEFLYLLYGLIGFVLLFLYYSNWKKKAFESFGKIITLKNLIPTYSKTRENIKFTMLLLCITALIIGIANPQIGTKMEEVKREGVDLMIALDLSNSMQQRTSSPIDWKEHDKPFQD